MWHMNIQRKVASFDMYIQYIEQIKTAVIYYISVLLYLDEDDFL